MTSCRGSARRSRTAGNASSSTSWRTSRKSSTSDAAVPRVGGYLRLVHPFPSLLDALVTGAIAAIAGGSAEVVVGLAVAMFCLQAGIGTANDLVDVAADKDGKPGKPIPAGRVTTAAAAVVLVVALVLGLALSALSGPPVLAVALAGTAIGLLYDLRLKGTPWSWLPFAVGIPLLPVYAWLGATGELPLSLLVLAALAVPAGTALALANALADVERDRSAGRTTVATTLGQEATWRIGAVLQAIVVVFALGTLLAVAGDRRGTIAAEVAGLVIGGGLALGHSSDPWRRERGWELQGVGEGLLAAAWLVGTVSTGTL